MSKRSRDLLKPKKSLLKGSTFLRSLNLNVTFIILWTLDTSFLHVLKQKLMKRQITLIGRFNTSSENRLFSKPMKQSTIARHSSFAVDVYRTCLVISSVETFLLTARPWAKRGSQSTRGLLFFNRAAMGRARFLIYLILVPIALFASLSRQGLGTRIEGLWRQDFRINSNFFDWLFENKES